MKFQDTNGNGTFIDELIMGVLALVSMGIVIIELNVELSANTLAIMIGIDTVIWLVFVVEYLYRFIKAENKKKFVLSNIIDLIAIIPVDRMFKALRFAKSFRLLRMFRGFAYLFRFIDLVKDVLHTTRFDYTLVVSSITILMGAVLISFVEKMEFLDALWWSFVTATTVGYGDISPSTGMGRIIACVLMLVGIGFIGMLTGTISTYFINIVGNKKSEDSTYKSKVINGIKEQLDDIDNLKEQDIDDICKVLKTLIRGD